MSTRTNVKKTDARRDGKSPPTPGSPLVRDLNNTLHYFRIVNGVAFRGIQKDTEYALWFTTYKMLSTRVHLYVNGQSPTYEGLAPVLSRGEWRRVRKRLQHLRRDYIPPLAESLVRMYGGKSTSSFRKRRANAGRLLANIAQLKRGIPTMPKSLHLSALKGHMEVLTEPVGPDERVRGDMENTIADTCAIVLMQTCPKKSAGRVKQRVQRFRTLELKSCYEKSLVAGGVPKFVRESVQVSELAPVELPEVGPLSVPGGEDIPPYALALRKQWASNVQETLAYEFSLKHPREPMRVKALGVVDSGNKFRVITKMPMAEKSLQGLQELLHSGLKNLPGVIAHRPVTEDDIRWLGEDPDCTGTEEFLWVSGDYDSATDYITGEAKELIAREIERGLPSSVLPYVHAFRATAAPYIVEYAKNTKIPSPLVSRGLLMGSLCSFPQLCILNYSVFKTVLPDRRVLINGDDILFRATASEIECWKTATRSTGLRLNKTKTIISSCLATLNSEYFLVSGGGDHVTVSRIAQDRSSLTNTVASAQAILLKPKLRHVVKRFIRFVSHDKRPLFAPENLGGMGGAKDISSLNSRERRTLKVFNNFMMKSASIDKQMNTRPYSSAHLTISSWLGIQMNTTKSSKRYVIPRRIYLRGITRSLSLQARVWADRPFC